MCVQRGYGSDVVLSNLSSFIAAKAFKLIESIHFFSLSLCRATFTSQLSLFDFEFFHQSSNLVENVTKKSFILAEEFDGCVKVAWWPRL